MNKPRNALFRHVLPGNHAIIERYLALMHIERRELGSTGLRVSRLGLGAANFGREIDEAAAFSILDYAAEQGINLLDTAEAYGGGQARDYRSTNLAIDDVREVSGEYHSSEKL